MADQKGSTAQILIGFESTYKTAPADGYQVKVFSCDVLPSKGQEASAVLTGSRNPVAPDDDKENVAGSIVVPPDSLIMPYWLNAMFGAPTTTGTDPYTHEYKIGDTMPSFTLEKGFTDLATDKFERLLGCKTSSMAVSFSPDGELRITLNVLGASGSLENSAFDASPTVLSLARLKKTQAAVEEGGASLGYATEVSINVDFGLDDGKFVISSDLVRDSIPEGIVSVTGNLKAIFRDSTLLDKAINGTESSLKITLTGSASSVLELEIQELSYAKNGVPIEGPQGLIQSLDFTGYYDDGSEASAIVARVTNAVISYSF